MHNLLYPQKYTTNQKFITEFKTWDEEAEKMCMHLHLVRLLDEHFGAAATSLFSRNY
jgi:hypothetical protein